MANGELGGFFKTMHSPKCPYNRQHFDNCNKVDQVSQLFFSRIVAAPQCRYTPLLKDLAFTGNTQTTIGPPAEPTALCMLTRLLS